MASTNPDRGVEQGSNYEHDSEGETRTLLGTGKLNYNSRAWRTSIPKEGVEDDPIFSQAREVAFFKEGDGRIVIESREQPVPSRSD